MQNNPSRSEGTRSLQRVMVPQWSWCYATGQLPESQEVSQGSINQPGVDAVTTRCQPKPGQTFFHLREAFCSVPSSQEVSDQSTFPSRSCFLCSCRIAAPRVLPPLMTEVSDNPGVTFGKPPSLLSPAGSMACCGQVACAPSGLNRPACFVMSSV